MTFQKFPDINQSDISDLGAKIQEFEHRKAGTFTFFERCCAKKPDEKRREIFFRLGTADWDFEDGILYGPDAEKAFSGIKGMGFSRDWAQALKYAYWFSLPKERKDFKSHIISGTVASRPELNQPAPDTPYHDVSTHELGKQLFSSQCSLVWPFAKENALLVLAQEQVKPVDAIVQIVKTAQNTAKEKGLSAGVQNLTDELLPCFFRQEQKAIKESKTPWPSHELLTSIARKKEQIEPYLKNFSWLYLTQAKFYQDMGIRRFLENSPKKPIQMLLPLSFGRERDE
ncbi:MAG: hypothetical protein IKS41_02070 [Alphaproteobacteria bacterium]|nr:hypothetical protein [Alphaproteobacteria bacterium]